MKRFEKICPRGAALVTLVWLTCAFAWPSGGWAQQQLAFGRQPRFLAPERDSGKPVEVDITRVAILRRRVALNQPSATIQQLLHEISTQTGIEFAYEPGTIPVSRVVGLRADSITVAAALTEILVDAGVDVLLKSPQQAVLLRRVLPGAITGRVTDSASSHGVAGAEVFLDGTSWRTVTDTAGRYRLSEVEPGAYILVVRRLGYKKSRRKITVRESETNTLDVALEPAAVALNELVTTATGRQRRLNVPNDITALNVDSIMRTQPVASLADILENRVPGLTVQRTSGAPGDPARLRLRGASSPLRSNDPIVVVDGIRVYSDQSGKYGGNLADASRAAPSPLDYLDPNTIETIEVVKGPSASTLYGPDAANGVIVVTTKKGRPGPARWRFQADYGRKLMAGRYPDLLFRWGHGLDLQEPMLCPVGDVTKNATTDGATSCQGDSVTTSQLLNDSRLTVLDKGRNAGVTLGVSGGSSSLTYAVTGSYRDELGLIKLPDYEFDRYQALEGVVAPNWMRRPQRFKQWGATSTISARISPTAEVSLTTTLSRLRQQKSSLDQQLGQLMSTYVDRSSGLYYRAGNTFTGISVVDSGISDYRLRATAAATQFTNVANVNWRARQWLTFTGDAGLNLDQRDDETFIPAGQDPIHTGLLNVGNGTTVVSTMNARALATAPLGRGFEFRFASGVNCTGTALNVTSMNTADVPPGTELVGTRLVGSSRDVQNDATFGWYVEPSVSHPRFTLNLGLRLDGGSSYGSGVSGLSLPRFPKLGFSYLLSDEPFFPLKRILPVFRVRAAYGRASRQPGLSDRLRLYGTTYQALGDSGMGDIVELASLGNTKLRPEQSTELEGGFDSELLDGRLFVTFSGYRKTTDDALLVVPVPPSVYGTAQTTMRNIGVTRNTGMEFTVTAQLLRAGSTTWSTQLTLSRRRDVVVRLGPGVRPFYTDVTNDGDAGTRVAPGYPLFGRWARPILGYTDANGNGVLEQSEVLLGDTAVYVGRQLPNYEATLQPSVSLWHGALAVNAVFAYADGLSQKNEVMQQLAPFSRGNNDPTASLAEQLATGTVAQDKEFNWVQTVSTMRFNDLSVVYTVPAAWARRVGAQRLSIAVQGVNLGLWTNYRGLDPNVNAFATGNSVTDTGVLPMPRTWQVRINADY